MTTSTTRVEPRMASQLFMVGDRRIPDVVPICRPQVGAARYQLNVIGSSVVDVVQSTAGWLFDRVMAGWEVNVLVSGHEDERPLQILGARKLDLHAEIASITRSRQRPALAVAAEIFAADEAVAREVLATLHRGESEVALWGDAGPGQFGGTVECVQHRLSGAARAFKGHALAAAGVPTDSVGPTEELFRGGATTRRPLDSAVGCGDEN
jgi:hypothetical protein